MARSRLPTTATLAFLALSTAACAATVTTRSPEPERDVVVVEERGPDERERLRGARRVEADHPDEAPLGIPPGHLPPPGECRVWFPGRPPGHQPAPRSCDGIEAAAPAGSWVLYRPARERREVHARVIDRRRAGVVVRVRVYHAERGTYLREGRP